MRPPCRPQNIPARGHASGFPEEARPASESVVIAGEASDDRANRQHSSPGPGPQGRVTRRRSKKQTWRLYFDPSVSTRAERYEKTRVPPAGANRPRALLRIGSVALGPCPTI